MTVSRDPIDTLRGPALDCAVLDSLLSMGTPQLRADLLAQLTQDFSKLRAEISLPDADVSARAAHVVKGLAGTVGAYRLEQLALAYDAVARSIGVTARQGLCDGLTAEIDRVLAALSARAAGSDGA